MPKFNPLDYPVGFSMPLRILPSGWLTHVPFGMVLIDILRPNMIVELGTHMGVSYAAFCQAVMELGIDTRCYAIDTWEGDPQAGQYGAEVLANLRAHHDPLYGGFSRLIQSTFDDALDHFENGSVDLLHIDGYHTYDSVRHDVETWLPKISGKGVVLLHDTNVRERDFGVWRLWHEVRGKYPHFELLHGHGLGLICVGGQIPQRLGWLLDSSPADLSPVRDFFFRMGQLTALRLEREQLSQALTNSDQAHSSAAAHVVELTDDLNKKQEVIEEVTSHVLELTRQLDAANQSTGSTEAHIRDLTDEIDRKNRAIEEVKSHVQELTAQLDTKNQAIEEARRHLEKLVQHANENERLTSDLVRQRIKSERTALEATARIADLERQVVESERIIQEFSSALFGWEAHWSGVQNSLAWRIGVQPIRHLRLLLAPRGTLRERLWFRLRKIRRGNPIPLATTAVSSPSQDAPVQSIDTSERPIDTVEGTLVGERTDEPNRQPATPRSEGAPIEVAASARLRMFLASQRSLRFPAVLTPRVSVVIPLLNQAHYTLMMLENLLASESDTPYEVVLVDDGSTDEIPQLLRQLVNVRIHVHDRNKGFGEACNRGAELAAGEYVCFLNSDAFPGPGWLTQFVRTFALFPECGAVGGKLLLPDGRLQEAGSILWEDGSCLGYGRDKDPLSSEYCYLREVDYCSAACLMVRRDVFASVGGFDPGYAPAYYEDVDLCMALRRAGHPVMFDPTVAILHMEHGSSDRSHAIALQLRNREYFVEKWRHYLTGRGMPGRTQELRRRDAREGRRVLIVDDRVPELRLGSGFPRTEALLKALVQAGFVISYLPTADPSPVQPMTSDLQDLGVEVLYGVIDVADKIAERAPICDAVIISRPHNATFMENVIEANPSAALIYDAEAVFSLREAREAEIKGKKWSDDMLFQRVAAELTPVESADLVLTVSEYERSIIAQHNSTASTAVWAHAIAARPKPTSWAERRDLLFVGFLGSAPNDDAVLYLLDAIFPEILQHVDCRLLLVGDGASAAVYERVAQLQGAVKIAGFVEDLEVVFGSSRLFVAPHRFAAGIPLKVVEAMAYGVPCVISQLLSELLGVSDGVEASVAADASEFVEKVLRVYQQREVWEHLRESALEFVRDGYDPTKMERALANLLNRAIEQKTGGAVY